MARRKLNDNNVRKLSKMGGGSSTGLTLPIQFLRKLGWRRGQKIVAKLRGKKITIQDWPASPKRKRIGGKK